MKRIENYVMGNWAFGSGNEKQLTNAITGEVVGVATAQGLHFGDVLQYGRTIGGSVFRLSRIHI